MDIQSYLEDGMAAADQILRCRDGTPPDDTEKEILSACVWGALCAWAGEPGAGGSPAAVMDQVLIRRLGCSPEESVRRRQFLERCTPESDAFLEAVIRGGGALRAAGADATAIAAFLRSLIALARRELETP